MCVSLIVCSNLDMLNSPKYNTNRFKPLLRCLISYSIRFFLVYKFVIIRLQLKFYIDFWIRFIKIKAFFVSLSSHSFDEGGFIETKVKTPDYHSLRHPPTFRTVFIPNSKLFSCCVLKIDLFLLKIAQFIVILFLVKVLRFRFDRNICV